MTSEYHDHVLNVSDLIDRPGSSRQVDLAVQADPYQPTDVFNFNAASVPSLAFFTGVHTDYHRPTDTLDRLSRPQMLRIAEFLRALVAATAK